MLLSNGLPSEVVHRTEAGLVEETQLKDILRPWSTLSLFDGDTVITGISIILMIDYIDDLLDAVQYLKFNHSLNLTKHW